MSILTNNPQCPDSIEELDEIVEECYACGKLDSNNLCKVHDEMLTELRIVNNV
jgi:hypothetical protein